MQLDGKLGASAPAREGFSIEKAEDGVYLTVSPTRDGAVYSGVSQIVAALKERGVAEYDMGKLVRAVSAADGVAVKVAELPARSDAFSDEEPQDEAERAAEDVPPAKKRRSPAVSVQISRDRMEAVLCVSVDETGGKLPFDEVLQKLRDGGVQFGVDEAAAREAYDCPETSVVVARGCPAVNGAAAYIKQHFDLENKGRPAELTNGKVDFKSLNLFTIVEEGQLLAEKVPATEGAAGVDVLGNEIAPKRGRDVPLPLGKNVRADSDGKIWSTVAGQLQIVGTKIHVAQLIEIKGDVDMSVGNIEFVGGVIVRGSVQQGFSVAAGGDVEVYGTVSGAHVEGKNVIVKTGIQGMHRGVVRAKEDVIASFIENATVIAGRNIMVSEAILHSNVNAGKKIMVQGRRGLIVGNTATAGEEIVAKVVGTPMATTTKLEVGINPLLRQEYQRIAQEVKAAAKELDETQKALAVLKAHQENLPPERREMLLKMTRNQFALSGRISAIRNRMTEIELAIDELKTGRIRISDTVHSGVKIVVGSQVKAIREPMRRASFYSDGHDIKVGAF